jgi:hypothetical protein
MPYHGNGYHVPPEHANRTAYYEGRGGCAGKTGKMWKQSTSVRGGTHRTSRRISTAGCTTRRRHRRRFRGSASRAR